MSVTHARATGGPSKAVDPPPTSRVLGGRLLSRLKIGAKLNLGFGVLVLLTAVVIGLSFFASERAATNMSRTTDLRAPSALASSRAQANLLKMLADVRGYLALGDESYRRGYNEARQAFEANLATLEALARQDESAALAFTIPEDYGARLDALKSSFAEWSRLPERLFTLHDDQLEREPGLRLLIKEGARPIAQIVVSIKKMLETQSRRESTAENMDLMVDMASFQSSFFAMVAGLRGYVTTARDNFKFEYTTNRAINDRAMDRLVAKESKLSGPQKKQLKLIAKVRETFLPLPGRIFEWVEGERRRMDLFLFRTEAIPPAETMLRLLGEIAADQQSLLQSDLNEGRVQLIDTQRQLVAAGLGAFLLALVLAYVFRANIVGPVQRLTSVAAQVGSGQLTARAQVESGDEIGTLARTFNQMSTRLGQTLDDLEERRRAEAEQNRMLESLSSQLSKYLSPQVYKSIFSGRQEVTVASRRKKLTVFFSDVVGFTEITDNLEAEELSNLLNHYLTEMSNIALEYGATIDKFIGDAMLLFFGDPETKGARKDAKRCVMMAIVMQRRMRELEQEWRDRGLERPFRIRIGIATGFCTVGNFGSQDRMDYTIIGNEVNLAARLESSAEPGDILIAHETYSLIKNSVMAEEQPPLTVKGFDKPIHCYKVEGVLDDLAGEGKVIHKERDGVRVLVDLTKQDKSVAIRTIREVLSQLED